MCPLRPATQSVVLRWAALVLLKVCNAASQASEVLNQNLAFVNYIFKSLRFNKH